MLPVVELSRKSAFQFFFFVGDVTQVSIACEPQGRVGTFSREAVKVFSRFVRHRARWLGWHRARPSAVNMRAVDAATFTNNVLARACFVLFFPTSVPIICKPIRTAFIVIP